MCDSLWGEPELVFSAPSPVSAQFSRHAVSFAAVATNFVLRLEPDTGPTSLSQVVSFRVPVSVAGGQRLIGYVHDLTFGVQRSPGVRVLIVADLAGTVKTLEFDFENETFPGQNDPLRIERFFSPQGLESSGAGGLGLVGPVAEYSGTISITIQRRNLKARGSVQIDTLDVFAILSPPTSTPAS